MYLPQNRTLVKPIWLCPTLQKLQMALFKALTFETYPQHAPQHKQPTSRATYMRYDFIPRALSPVCISQGYCLYFFSFPQQHKAFLDLTKLRKKLFIKGLKQWSRTLPLTLTIYHAGLCFIRLDTLYGIWQFAEAEPANVCVRELPLLWFSSWSGCILIVGPIKGLVTLVWIPQRTEIVGHCCY